MADKETIERLIKELPRLSKSQLLAIENIVSQFNKPAEFVRDKNSDLVSDCILREFGDALRIHHCFSIEPFTKDKFEYALEKVCNACGVKAVKATRNNPGSDLLIGNVRFSLKTQADTGIKVYEIHISKFMELGKGEWGENVSDLEGLRVSFFEHMKKYERILTLRRLKDDRAHLYELVEIPKSLLLSAKSGTFRIMADSKQKGAKPGYCDVYDQPGKLAFQLYFDGGGERKLQIKHIRKALCIVHATWKFDKELAGPHVEEGIATPQTKLF